MLLVPGSPCSKSTPKAAHPTLFLSFPSPLPATGTSRFPAGLQTSTCSTSEATGKPALPVQAPPLHLAQWLSHPGFPAVQRPFSRAQASCLPRGFLFIFCSHSITWGAANKHTFTIVSPCCLLPLAPPHTHTHTLTRVLNHRPLSTNSQGVKGARLSSDTYMDPGVEAPEFPAQPAQHLPMGVHHIRFPKSLPLAPDTRRTATPPTKRENRGL